ncbi:MAG: hypothetical protein Q8K20_00350 [Gemmobacter sp.]|nr:hypothetical protein [Gemmobacter sp.]
MPLRKHPTFEDRLARLKEAEHQARDVLPPAPAAARLPRNPVAAPPDQPPAPPAEDPAPRRKLPVARIVFMVGLGIVAGGAMMLPGAGSAVAGLSARVAGLLPLDPAGPVAVVATVAAPPVVAADAVAPPSETAGIVMVAARSVAPPTAPGLFDRLTAFVSGTPAEPPVPRTLPAEFLPPAPAGWLRVTGADAGNPGALERLAADWALLPDALPLSENKGIGLLEQFISEASPTPEHADLRAQAVYLAGNGDYLSVTLKFRSAGAAFGPKDDSLAWRQTLRAEVKREAGTGDVIEALTVGGIQMINRTRPEGKSHLSRPVGKDFDVANGLRLTAAVSHRAEVQVNGHATPAAAGALIAAIDRKALAALLE